MSPAREQTNPSPWCPPSGGTNAHSYFHANRQGSTVAMSNDAGTMSEGPYTYDAYGNGALRIPVHAGPPFRRMEGQGSG